MSQDLQGRSPGSLEWEAMGWDLFPDTSQDLQKTEQRAREREKRMEQTKPKAERKGQVYQVYIIKFMFGEEP